MTLAGVLREAREALEWVVDCDPDLFGHGDPEKGAPLTPVADALAAIDGALDGGGR